MGVRTTADEKLEEAREAVNKAVLALNEIVVLECWGHDEYDEKFRADIEAAFNRLRDIKRKLSP